MEPFIRFPLVKSSTYVPHLRVVLVSKLPDFRYLISGPRLRVLDFKYSISRQAITQ